MLLAWPISTEHISYNWCVMVCLQGLELLYDDLCTMATLVYECHIDCSITFEHIRSMSLLERLRLMMNRVGVFTATTASNNVSSR